jgi:hypothetical protein
VVLVVLLLEGLVGGQALGVAVGLEVADDAVAEGGVDQASEGDEDGVANDSGESHGGDEQDAEGDEAVEEGDGDVADDGAAGGEVHVVFRWMLG